jgi:hypothetical protein
MCIDFLFGADQMILIDRKSLIGMILDGDVMACLSGSNGWQKNKWNNGP